MNNLLFTIHYSPMTKKTLTLLLLLFSITNIFAQKKETYLFAEKDTSKLYMDVYIPKVQNEQQACLFFVFGGGFVGGQRDGKHIESIQEHYTDKGYVVIAIDYRLGMRGQSNYSALIAVKKFEAAIYMAAEDLISALDYTLKNLLDTKAYKINPKNILVMGSSAGAVTALQADYAICNGYLNSNILPADFHLAGVISYAGAIFSTHGKPKYKNHEPAPTLLCQGTEDRLVNYKKTQLANLGFFGSNAIAKQFKKNGYNYHIRRYSGLGHQVAAFCYNEFDLIDQFISEQVFSNKTLIQIDETYFNAGIEPKWMNLHVRDLKKAEQ